jgi:hypothetical protein
MSQTVLTSSMSVTHEESRMHRRFGSYWVYSVGVGVALVIVLAIVETAEPDDLHTFLLVLAGFAIGWVSGTIARYAYPPPRQWTGAKTSVD